MASVPHDTRPTCLHCGLEILAGERVSYHHGDFVHFTCYVAAPVAHVGAGIAQQRERPLCVGCIAAEFGLTSKEVEDAVRELASTTRFAVRFDVCWRCRERRMTLSAKQSASP